MASLAALQAELAEREGDIQVCLEMLAMEPTDVDAQETKAILEEQVAGLKAQIAALSSAEENVPPPPPPPSADVATAPKYDMSKHPKFRKASPDASPQSTDDAAQQIVLNVKDSVMAKFSEDKQWYHATIVSKTGSSTDPVYTVTFKGYGNTETKRKHEIRAVHNESKKRKADGQPAPQVPASPALPHVISAAPSVDTTLVPRREPSKVSDGPTRMAPEPKKLKGNKALDKAKSSWNDWQKSGPKKTAVTALPKKKDSQFRTPEGGKVGFTGYV